MRKIFNLLISPRKVLLIILTKIGGNLNDTFYLHLWYYLKMRKPLNLNNPKTYNEKLQWLKINDRNPLYRRLVDKYEVKKYVSESIGSQYIIPNLGVWDKFEDIDFERLPKQFVLKCTHDSGGLVICTDKDKLDKKKAEKKINKSLNKTFYNVGRELVYKDVEPRIIAEEYKVDESGKELKDYKFFCFDGEPKMMFIATGRPHNTKFDFYDIEFNHLDIINGYPNSDKKNIKPRGFDDMIKLSRELSRGIPHVRVDFYDVNGRVFFGEMTFFHHSGAVPFKPKEWDYKMGDMIKLPIKNKKG